MSQLKNEPKKDLTAVILCAGEGKRLKKVTIDTPKPLLKLDILENKTILQNTITQLITLGIKRILIVIGHLGTAISDYISRLSRNNISLQNKLIIINSENQYKLGPLYSFLSITKNKTVYKDNNYYLLIPGDTIFDFHLLKRIFSIISKNYNLFVKYPIVFYRTMEKKQLQSIKKKKLVVSHANLDTSLSEILIKGISQLNIKKIDLKTKLNEIIPAFSLNYASINEILNLKDKTPFTTVWEVLNYMISNEKKVIGFNIESQYQFLDIDEKSDLKKI
ncbi:MAG: sugar phosphate nucleotidyltransferase [Candidatus Odinarchaeota archaeon]